MTTIMPDSVNADRLELAAGSAAPTHLSRAAFNGDGLWVAGDSRCCRDGVIPGKDTGVDDMLRRE